MYEWTDHTAELELSIAAPTEDAVFADAFQAFAELAGDGGSAADERREVVVEADSRELLLVEWLGELIYLADADGFIPMAIERLELRDGRLRAVVGGHSGEPRPLVKAVTLHRLEFRPEGENGWRARAVLDV